MRKKVVSNVVVLAMICGILLLIPAEEARAADSSRVIDGSILLDDAEESVGEMIPITKGQYFQNGSSSIGKIGIGKIKVSSTTIAQKQVATIKAAVMVERLVNGSWVSYTSWTATKNNTYSLVTAKEMTVPRGYYYRVRTVHDVASDRAYSNTSGLFID